MGLTLGGAPGFETTRVITVDYQGPVKIKLGVGSQAYVTTLNYSGTLGSGAVALTNNGGCGYNVITFNNVNPGVYFITLSLTTNITGIGSLGACGQIEYPKYGLGAGSTGITEFFFQGFEDSTPGQNSVVEDANAHTGRRYYSGSVNHTVSFTLPNTRQYVIEYWWRDASNNWNYASKPYTGPTLMLTESKIIDDIRIHPADGPMKSFAYDPTFGMTEMIDENGRRTFYQYDSQGRLGLIKDDGRNVLKVIEYSYK
jgi:YD repeat-containing protein